MSGPLLWSWNTRSPQIHRTAQTRSELFCFLKPNWIHFLNVGTDSPQRRRKVRRIWDRPVPSAQRRATPGRSDTFPDWFPEVLNPQPANRPYRGANPDGPSSSHSKHGNSYKMTRSHEEGRVKAATFGKVVRIIQVIFCVSTMILMQKQMLQITEVIAEVFYLQTCHSWLIYFVSKCLIKRGEVIDYMNLNIASAWRKDHPYIG